MWDWMKYKIRQDSILYSKYKAKERRKKLQTIENKLKICENVLAESPTQENVAKLEALKAEYEREYDYIARGSIIRSRATWFEKGERNTKYFLNLENNNKRKSCVRKLVQENGKECTKHRQHTNRCSIADNYGSLKHEMKSFFYYRIVRFSDRLFFRVTGSKKVMLRTQ